MPSFYYIVIILRNGRFAEQRRGRNGLRIMSLIEIALFVINLILLLWILQLKMRVDKLEDEKRSQPPEPEALTVRDLRHLQKSLAELVRNVEEYTESQLAKMRLQTETLRILCDRLESKLRELDEPPIPRSDVDGGTRVVPLSPKQNSSRHKDRDKIIELHRRGWPMEKIAEELRITRGEVQLIVNLS